MEPISLSIEDKSAMLRDSQLGKDFLRSWQIRQCGIIKGLASSLFMKLFQCVRGFKLVVA